MTLRERKVAKENVFKRNLSFKLAFISWSILNVKCFKVNIYFRFYKLVLENLIQSLAPILPHFHMKFVSTI